MKLWMDKATKSSSPAGAPDSDGPLGGGDYQITSGALQFVLGDKQTLLLRVTDGRYLQAKDIATVSGTLVGYLQGSQQWFTAERVVWDSHGQTLNAETVRYVAPGFEVSGSKMSVDLTTDEVRFEGPVEAGV